MKTKNNLQHYVEWQNRAFHFYLASRLLILNDHIVPAVFCAQQTIELILKATLIYHDKSFNPENAKHRFKGMINSLQNKAKGAENFNIPEYFYYDKRYQSFSRYPSKRKDKDRKVKELFLPDNILDDLDKCFFDLLVLVPLQSNTLLVKTLSAGNERSKKKLNILRRKNRKIKYFRQFLKK